ncbi:MAG: MBL fold metallo-hydrolase [Pirellulales bacterium]
MLVAFSLGVQLSSAQGLAGKKPPDPVLIFSSGTINSAHIICGTPSFAIYSPTHDSSITHLLLTHHRRDLLGPAYQYAKRTNTTILGPKAEQDQLENPEKFWNSFSASRFHDYQCQSTKRAVKPLTIQPVDADSKLQIHGVDVQVLNTPGFTRGSVSYIIKISGKNVAFTGDLIYGDGQLFDLYSFQDSVESASIRGYHGYAARLAQLVESLKKIREQNPSMIIPARGPVITNPAEAIDKLIGRVQKIYLNYLSTTALHWYFKTDRMRQCAEAVQGGAVSDLELMTYAVHKKAPDWIFENATSRMLISDSGAGLLIDCGYQKVIDAVDQQIKSGIINKVEAIFVTHYHDDHTDMVQAAAEKYQCPVYCTEEYYDILANPAAFQMPAMTDKPIKNIQAFPDGHKMKWHEFDLTFYFFPGQAIYHGALLAERPDSEPVFFIGDSFAPSGFDDYCLLNRNLISPNNGYFLCLNKLRKLDKPVWLMNQHISQVFQFTSTELDYLQSRYTARQKLLAELFPWDDPNYGIDERWAKFFPYAQTVGRGQSTKLELRITNHSSKTRKYDLVLNPNDDIRLKSNTAQLTVEADKIGSAQFELQAGSKSGLSVVTASIKSDGIDLADWAECLIVIQ